MVPAFMYVCGTANTRVPWLGTTTIKQQAVMRQPILCGNASNYTHFYALAVYNTAIVAARRIAYTRRRNIRSTVVVFLPFRLPFLVPGKVFALVCRRVLRREVARVLIIYRSK